MERLDIGSLAPTLLADIQKMGADAELEAGRILTETASEMKDEASLKAPRSKGQGTGGHHLSEALSVTPSRYNTVSSMTFYVSATKWHKYSIVHLLELGHMKAYGAGYVPGRPFMDPALEKYKPILDQRISDMLDGLGR